VQVGLEGSAAPSCRDARCARQDVASVNAFKALTADDQSKIFVE
jgi:hypothetical protein